jgi:small-conductance mechanosensitive channel
MRLFAFLLCLVMPFAAVAQPSEQPSGTITIADSAGQDEAIANRIRDILAELDGYEDVAVSARAGIVTLSGSTIDAAAAQRLSDLVGRIEGVAAIENEITQSTDVAQRLDPAWERFLARGQRLVTFLPLALVAVSLFALVVALGFAIARWRQPWERLAPNAFIADLYRQIVRLAFVVAGLVVALDILNATALLSGILGAAGIVGLAIGFAVRDTVENFIASIMLSIRQPFRPNDTVEIEGDIGKVIRLTSRATILLSYDGNHIRIPNSTVFKSRIVNFSRNAERRFTFELGVAPDADLVHAQSCALDVLNNLPFVLQTPQSSVWVEAIGDSSVVMGLAAWIDQNETSIILARSEAIRLVQGAYDSAGLGAPFPTYRLMHEGAEVEPQSGKPESKNTDSASKPAPAPQTAQDVEAKEDKQLAEIIDQERAGEPVDLLRANGDQE